MGGRAFIWRGNEQTDSVPGVYKSELVPLSLLGNIVLRIGQNKKKEKGAKWRYKCVVGGICAVRRSGSTISVTVTQCSSL